MLTRVENFVQPFGFRVKSLGINGMYHSNVQCEVAYKQPSNGKQVNHQVSTGILPVDSSKIPIRIIKCLLSATYMEY